MAILKEDWGKDDQGRALLSIYTDTGLACLYRGLRFVRDRHEWIILEFRPQGILCKAGNDGFQWPYDKVAEWVIKAAYDNLYSNVI